MGYSYVIHSLEKTAIHGVCPPDLRATHELYAGHPGGLMV